MEIFGFLTKVQMCKSRWLLCQAATEWKIAAAIAAGFHANRVA
jgi:hypothetical protein